MPKRRVPLSTKGEKTYHDIIETAQALFLDRGYHKTSVLTISKAVGISPAAFYQYFDSKETVFSKICDRFFDFIFDFDFRSFTNDRSVEELLDKLLNRFFDLLWENRGVYKVFREAEFIDLEIGKAFSGRLHQKLSDFLNRKTTPEESRAFFWFLWGPIYYLSGFWILWKGEPVSPEVRSTLKSFLLNGISRGEFVVNENVYLNLSEESAVTEKAKTKGEITRNLLLEASEELFGRNGFTGTGIHRISEAAQCSVGTVYVYFRTKEDILRELVHQTGRELRHQIKGYAERFTDRRDQELAAYCGFLHFFRKHRWMYAIVREAEFVDASISISYYASLQKPYETALKSSIDRGEISPYEPEHLAPILMGIGHAIGYSLFLIENAARYDNRSVLEPLSQFILYGFDRFIRSHEALKIPAKKAKEKKRITEGSIGAAALPTEALISSTKNREVIT